MVEKRNTPPMTARARGEKSGRKPGSKGKGPRATPGPVLEHRLAGFVTGGEVARAVGVAPSTITKQAMAGAAWTKDLGIARAAYRWLVDLPAYVEEVLPTLLPEGEVIGRLAEILRALEARMIEHRGATPGLGRVRAALRQIAAAKGETREKVPARKSRRKIDAPAAG